MKIRHVLLELPEKLSVLNEIIADPEHELKSTALSSVVQEGTLRHFVLVIWGDKDPTHHSYLPGPQY
ncbi:MAG TPA: hypothetical protein VGP72_11865 [Planctomycetota bacterium]|jgi:hypothetical protein